MKLYSIHFSSLLVIVVCVSGLDIEYYDLNKAPDIFVQFIQDYNKVYRDNYDLLVHFEAFKHNLNSINESNRVNKGLSKIYINEFADLTFEEQQRLRVST